MFLRIADDGAVHLQDRDNFRAFKLVVAGDRSRLDRARRAATGLAEFADAETAWIFAAALRRLPAVADDAAWQQNLSAMIDKARPHGWVDDRRQAIKAHVEWLA